MAKVDAFNAPDGPPVFFISLKAGGTGLNLTAADYVIHYNPRNATWKTCSGSSSS